MLETQGTRRLSWLLWGMVAWVGAIVVRLIWLQIFQHDELLKLAQQQQQKTIEIPAARGTILDRFGQPLAKSLPAESVCVNPRRLRDIGVAADLLSRILDLDRAKLFERLQAAKASHSGFMWIKRKISADEAERLKSLHLDWVEFREELRRFYPHATLAAHVLGSTGFVDEAERGNAGIEMSFDEDLAGRPGLAQVYTDAKPIPYDSVIVRKPEPGSNLILSIDPNLQYIAERELEKAARSSRAESGSIIVMNPYTGDILAMGNYPSYDPNVPPSPKEPAHARSNLAIATPFEPGSVFKVITLTSALENTPLTPDTPINCGNGVINLYGRIIHDDHRYSVLSMADVLAKSSNIGAINVALRVGDKPLYGTQRKFGFGAKTGIELPGESAGILHRVSEWTPSSIGSLAMGHEVSVTSLQLAIAGAVIANGGLKVRPRLVIGRQRLGQPVEQYQPEPGERIIRPQTAITMRQMMEGVVLRGTGRNHATLRGYTSGGKTGSAQVYDLKNHLYTHTYNASFLGFAPVANPQILIAVTLNKTQGGTAGYGGPVAAPVFREVAMNALRMMDVPKDLPEGKILAATSAQDSANEQVLVAHSSSATSRSVSSVTPPPVHEGSSASAEAPSLDRRPFLSPSGESVASIATGPGPRVPDFNGLPLRVVLEEAAASGLKVEVVGKGLARSQEPPPGTALSTRTVIRVHFGK
jgi:cell division protein FtsI (penicillin-binding protein 3)